LAGSFDAMLVRYIPDAKMYTRILFEREEGRKGTGHDFDFLFKHQDFIFPTVCKRGFTSYYRQVKDISLQTIDTSYQIVKGLSAGYSIAFKDFNNGQLLGYGLLDLKYLSYEIRINPNTTITRIKVHYEKDKDRGIIPFISFEYINTGDNIDWKEKIGLRWKFQQKQGGK